MQWEYLIEQDPGYVRNSIPPPGRQPIDVTVNALGRDGWELVAITTGGAWVFKRPLPEPQQRRGPVPLKSSIAE